MKLYELIIAIHPWFSTEESNDLIAKVEWLFPNGVKNKDDIWYQTIYNIQGLKTLSKVYFISYLVETDPHSLPEIKQKMSLMKGLVRTLFLAKSPKEDFHMFEDLNAGYVEKIQALASKDKKAKKTKDQKQQLLDTAKEVEVEITEDGSEDDNLND